MTEWAGGGGREVCSLLAVVVPIFKFMYILTTTVDRVDGILQYRGYLFDPDATSALHALAIDLSVDIRLDTRISRP